MLVCALSEPGGPGKLRSHWEQEVHLIVEQKGDLPVSEVPPEGRKGKSRILHRNLLLPCDFLRSDLPKPGPQRSQERRRSAPANQGSEFHQHGGDSGDEGQLLGLSPTELEMLSTPTAETDNHGQANLDGAQEDLLPDDMENLSEHGVDTPVLHLTLKHSKNPHYNKSQQDLIIMCETAIHRIFFVMIIMEIQVTIPSVL